MINTYSLFVLSSVVSMDMHVDIRVDMHVDIRVDVHVDMRVDMRVCVLLLSQPNTCNK
jgi:hypothetical protein